MALNPKLKHNLNHLTIMQLEDLEEVVEDLVVVVLEEVLIIMIMVDKTTEIMVVMDMDMVVEDMEVAEMEDVVMVVLVAEDSEGNKDLVDLVDQGKK